MFDVFTITVPIYLLIALGYGLARSGLLEAAGVRGLGRYVLLIAMPTLLFNTVAQRPLGDLLNPRYLVAYAFGSLLVLLLGYAWARRVRDASPSLAATMSLGMASSNTGYIGLPIAIAVLGPQAAGPVAMAFLVENLIVIPLASALADASTGRSRMATVGTALRNLPKNPLLMAVILGLLAAMFSLQLPQVLQRPISMVAASATPVALVAIGASMLGLTLAGVKLDMGAVALGKLVAHPIAVALTMTWLLPGDAHLQSGGVLLAAMPMLGIYPLLAQRWGHERFAAATLVFTMAASFLTINLTLWALARVA